MRRHRSATHANRGKAWEAVIDSTLTRYHRDGQVAGWFPTHPEVKITQHLGKGKVMGFLKDKGPPDRVVAVTGGPSLLLDLKDTQGPRFDFSLLEPHQALRFSQWSGSGRVAGILLRLDGLCFVLPWERFAAPYMAWMDGKASRTRARPGTASLTLEQVRAAGLPFDETGWLGPLMQWWRAQ